MDDQVNAIIDLDVTRLNFPLRPLYARRYKSFVALLRNAPADVQAVKIRLWKAGEENFYYDFPCNPKPDGSWLCYIIGTAFPESGASRYEVHATDAKDNPTALGGGEVLVGAFAYTNVPATPGSTVDIETIHDANGNVLILRAVFDGENWTTIVEEENP